MPQDLHRYPRLASYLAGLPEGAASYPECRARASLLLNHLDGMPTPRPGPGDLPAPAAQYLAARPRALWLPEVHVMSFSLAVADHFGMDDDAYLTWVQSTNRGYFRNLVVRWLLAFVSPLELIARGSARWAAIHEGSTLTSRAVGEREARVELSFPPGLFAHPTLLKHFNAVWSAVLEHSNARDTEVWLVESSDTRATYGARWS